MRHAVAAVALIWSDAASALSAAAFQDPPSGVLATVARAPAPELSGVPPPRVQGRAGWAQAPGLPGFPRRVAPGAEARVPPQAELRAGGARTLELLGAPSQAELRPQGAVPGEQAGGPMLRRESYDIEEWASTAPRFTPEEESELLRGTDPSQNLCLGGFAVPELMVIGPPKTGTTSLCSALRYTPSALFPASVQRHLGSTWFPAKWKEGHFFDEHARNKLAMYDYGECDASVRRIAVEGTARYSNDPRVLRHIDQAYGPVKGQIKFVYIIRDPLPRLLSQVSHGKDQLWCFSYLLSSFEQICKRILKGKASDWFGGNNLGCADTVEGSMYANHIQRYFAHFEPSQFRFIPFKFITSPGVDGRPAKPVAQELWEQLGARGQLPPTVHANKRSDGTPESLLTPATFVSISAWFDEQTGPEVLAGLLASTEATLWGFAGVRDTASVAEWIRANW